MKPTIEAPGPVTTGQRRRELGDFLRARRAQLSPDSLGLPVRARRRTPGLRREEVAELAGIGVDWCVRLEQGRPVTPSAATVAALAQALRLSEAERQHLSALAGTDGTGAGSRARFRAETASPALRRLVAGLTQPAYVTGRRRDLIAWNDAAAQVLGFGRLAPGDRNLLVAMLTSPRSRELFGRRWASEAQRMVAQFRLTHDLWADDPAFTALLARLRAGCPEFDGWWARHDVRLPAAGRKTLYHRDHGVLAFDHASFQCNGEPGLKLTIYTPAAS